jgi:hypothetical protein
LLNVLPRGLVRIRHYGILSDRHRHHELLLCRQLLENIAPAEAEPQAMVKLSESAVLVTPTHVCPKCGARRMIVIEELSPLAINAVAAWAWREAVVDSS